MLAAVAKVFLSDTSHLRDLYRVVSFLGLGASLLLLAFLYQRFVFGRVRDPLLEDVISHGIGVSRHSTSRHDVQ